MSDAEAWDELIRDVIDVERLPAAIDSFVEPGEGESPRRFRRRLFQTGVYPYPTRLQPREYLEQKRELQVELTKLQNWVKDSGARILALFEGRDAAGKGSTIRRFMEYLNPRGARVVALVKPTDTERTQWYFQRYADHLPSGGELVFFDRSWYNRAGVERVMNFCTEAQYWEFVRQAPLFEEMLVADGILLFKFYLSVSKGEQARRFHERATNPLKQWKLSPIDREAQERWDEYTEAKEQTMRLTDTEITPWTLVKSDDKLRGRLETMRTVLHRVDYDGKDPAVACEPDRLIVASAKDVFAKALDEATAVVQ